MLDATRPTMCANCQHSIHVTDNAKSRVVFSSNDVLLYMSIDLRFHTINLKLGTNFISFLVDRVCRRCCAIKIKILCQLCWKSNIVCTNNGQKSINNVITKLQSDIINYIQLQLSTVSVTTLHKYKKWKFMKIDQTTQEDMNNEYTLYICIKIMNFIS